jgi:U3 small nucleolar RNA-associated protein 4
MTISPKAISPPARRTRNASKRKSSKVIDELGGDNVADTKNLVATPVKTPAPKSARKRSKITQDSGISEDSKIVAATPSRRRSARLNSDTEDDSSVITAEIIPRSTRKKKTKSKEDLKVIEESQEETSPKENKMIEKVVLSTKKVEGKAESLKSNELAVQVHRFRNANYIPKSILRLCATPYSPENNNCPYLAISREGGGVELVSVNEKWKCVATVEGMKNRNVDAMAWVCGNCRGKKTEMADANTRSSNVYFCKDFESAEDAHSRRRLFGASRDGTLFEIDFRNKRHKGIIGSGGGAVFCLVTLCPTCATNRGNCGQMIAAGCEDGSVRIYKAEDTLENEVNSPCLSLLSTLPSVGGAITSIAWTPGTNNGLGGSVIYVGVADGTIRQFECRSATQNASITGSAFHAISTGTVLSNEYNNTDSSDFESTPFSLQWKAGPRITVENRGRRSSTKIWALHALKDGTIISGDSMGNVQFWDAKATTLIQSFEHNPNNADILDLAVSFEQNKVMASGIDSKVICIERIPDTKKWVLTNQQRSHTHDVNSLAMVYMSDPSGCCLASKSKTRELLCSGGIDTKVCSYFIENMKKYRAKVAYRYPTKAPVSLSREPRIVSIMRADKIDFYQLATHEPVINSVALDEQQAYLGSVGIQSNFNLMSFDVSHDGRFLATSHCAGSFLFSLSFLDSLDESGLRTKVVVPRKISFGIYGNIPYSVIKFGSDGILACVKVTGEVIVLKIIDESESVLVQHVHTFDCKVPLSKTNFPPSQMTISHDGQWLSVASNGLGKGAIQVYSVKNEFIHWWTLPCTEAPVSCIKFLGCDLIQPALAVACNNGVFYLFDVEQRRLSDWSEDLGFPASKSLPRELSMCPDCPDSIAFNPSAPNKVVMGGHSWFCAIDLTKPVPNHSRPFPPDHFKARNWSKRNLQNRQRSNSLSEKGASEVENNSHDAREEDTIRNFTICLRYAGIIFQDFIRSNEMLVLEQPWMSVVDTLPGALERQRYGS